MTSSRFDLLIQESIQVLFIAQLLLATETLDEIRDYDVKLVFLENEKKPIHSCAHKNDKPVENFECCCRKH